MAIGGVLVRFMGGEDLAFGVTFDEFSELYINAMRSLEQSHIEVYPIDFEID